ncbi:MAG TPA: ABC transporter permease, partial [Puia sp.]|nr:ABC transporter permease [Puia sp.]
MFRNYFKTAWRSLMRNKINSIINIGGLSIAIASVIFIMMYVKDELAFDQFFKDADHIFQVNSKFTDKGVTSTSGGNTAPAVTPTMFRMYPEIESFARIYRPGDVMIRYESNEKTTTYFTEHRLMAVDSNFLEIFNYPFLQGDAMTCLQKPDGVVITEATAKKYFGNENAIGKILLFDTDKKPFTVTAVLMNIPAQSTFQFDLLAPISAYSVVKKRSWNWAWLQVNSYVKLKPALAVDEASIAKLEAKFPAMVREHAFKKEQDYDEFTKKGNKIEYELMPFTDVHLHAIPLQSPARLTNLGDVKYVYIFSAIAFFIIILACVNFMNLSTAQSTRRSKEIGIRKVLGSEKKQLVKQFLSEAMMYSFISTIFAICLVLISLDLFNGVAGKSFNIHSIFSSSTILFVVSLCILTGLLAGLYPAFYLSSFNPVVVLKGIKVFKNNLGNLLIRNGLVIFQYTISIALIICSIVVFRQLKYTQ